MTASAWTALFRDEFDGTALSEDWIVIEGTGYPGGPQNGFGTDEIETMTASPANVEVSGGALRITPARDAEGRWFSARVETRKVFKPLPGQVMRISAVLALPDVHGVEAAGYWPAFWALGATQRDDRWSWPGCGELDVMESVNGLATIWQTMHAGYPGQRGGPFDEPTGRGNGGRATPGSSDPWGSFFAYTVAWERTHGEGRDEVHWYVDDLETLVVRQPETPADVWSAATGHAGDFLILDVAVGGQFVTALGGGPSPSTRPGVPMVVDSVAVEVQGRATRTDSPS